MDIKAYRAKAPSISADLAALFQKHGLKMDKLTASVDELGGTVRYSITAADTNLKDESGNAIDADALYYKNMAGMYDLKPEWLGRTFQSGGKIYKVVGLKNTKAKNCVVILVDGETARKVGPAKWVKDCFDLAEFRKAGAAS